MLFRAKSKQFKQLGKLSIMPALFNINEPIIFGTPVVFNIRLFVPFVMTPVIIALVSYFAIKSGLVPLFGAIVPPWQLLLLYMDYYSRYKNGTTTISKYIDFVCYLLSVF